MRSCSLELGIASVTDLELNLLGSILSLLAIATTCVGQIVSCTECLAIWPLVPKNAGPPNLDTGRILVNIRSIDRALIKATACLINS